MDEKQSNAEQAAERTNHLFDRVSEQLSRRGFLSNTAKVGGGAIALSAGGGTAAAAGDDHKHKGKKGNDENENEDNDDVSTVEVLNFALTLEKLEATFYEEGLASSGGMFDEHDIERSDAAKNFASPPLQYSTYQYLGRIRDHERAHVEALTAAINDLGGEPVSGLEFEFPYETVEEFIELARVFEDTGAAAYTGAVELIDNEEYLQAAAQILAVEARHASYLRVLNTQVPFPNAFQPALTMEQVKQRVAPFIVGMDDMGNKQMFTVTVKNVSEPGTISTKRAKGVVPLSPGAWAVFSGDNPAFMPGGDANDGTERIAEDGFPGGDLPPESGGLADTLAEAENVSDSGTFASPGGTMDNPALFPGESATFTVMAGPEDMFTMETMFVQSNDWFYGFEGLSLFDGDDPIEGDVTSELGLYDAGTEEDTRPGHGPKEPPGPVQKPVQDPMAIDVGTDEDKPIQLAEERHPEFNIPDAEEVISVTVEPK